MSRKGKSARKNADLQERSVIGGRIITTIYGK